MFVSDHSGSPGDREVARAATRAARRAPAASGAQLSAREAGGRRSASRRPEPSASRIAAAPARQVEPVEPENAHASGAAGRRARAARARAPRRGGDASRSSSAAQHEQQVGDVHVGAHAVGEHRHAREEEQRGERPGRPAEPLAAEAVDHPAAAPTARGSASATVTSSTARGPSGASTSPSSLEQRVRGGGDRDFVGRAFRRARAARPRRARRACRS